MVGVSEEGAGSAEKGDKWELVSNHLSSMIPRNLPWIPNGSCMSSVLEKGSENQWAM